MKLSVILAASMLAIGATSSQAADQAIDLSSGYGSFIGNSPLLDGGDDVTTQPRDRQPQLDSRSSHTRRSPRDGHGKRQARPGSDLQFFG
ncbi:MAG: hypothetical protein IPG91_18070 [Ideonella sp.]|nr:hypothetical protein [Ideonella sp.]